MSACADARKHRRLFFDNRKCPGPILRTVSVLIQAAGCSDCPTGQAQYTGVEDKNMLARVSIDSSVQVPDAQHRRRYQARYPRRRRGLPGGRRPPSPPLQALKAPRTNPFRVMSLLQRGAMVYTGPKYSSGAVRPPWLGRHLRGSSSARSGGAARAESKDAARVEPK